MENFLTESERNLLKAKHKKERDKRVCDRIKAVLLFDNGWAKQEIAEVLILTVESVRLHIQEYRTSQKLKPENGGSSSKLTKEQTENLLGHLQDHTYLYTKEIVAYVKSAFDLEYTVAGMFSWLKAHGFSYALSTAKCND